MPESEHLPVKIKSPLKIALLTSEDPRDRKTFSGTTYQIMKALNENFSEVILVGPIRINRLLLKGLNALKRIIEKLSSKRYSIGYSILLSCYYSIVIKERLKSIEFDLVFGPVVACEIAFLHIKKPIVYFSDSSFNQLRDYYKYFSGMSWLAIKESNYIEKRALLNSTAIIQASEWTSDYIKDFYQVDKKNIYVVPMGANLDDAPPLGQVEEKLHHRETCNLLFIGVDWERKGGAIAFDSFMELNMAGLDTRLTICGCTPPEVYAHSKMKVYPFLNKNEPADYSQFQKLLREAHFLIFPTRAECQGIVICEASAYGVPSITTKTGGIAGVLENGINGYQLDLEAGASEYAELILQTFNDEQLYRKLVYQSRSKYEKELNWGAWGLSVKQIIQARMNEQTNIL